MLVWQNSLLRNLCWSWGWLSTCGYQEVLGHEGSVWMWAVFIHTTILRPVHTGMYGGASQKALTTGSTAPAAQPGTQGALRGTHQPGPLTQGATCALQTKGWLPLQHIILSTDTSCLKCNPKNYVEAEYSVEGEHSLLNTAWNYQKIISLFQERVSYILSFSIQFLFRNPN